MIRRIAALRSDGHADPAAVRVVHPDAARVEGAGVELTARPRPGSRPPPGTHSSCGVPITRSVQPRPPRDEATKSSPLVRIDHRRVYRPLRSSSQVIASRSVDRVVRELRVAVEPEVLPGQRWLVTGSRSWCRRSRVLNVRPRSVELATTIASWSSAASQASVAQTDVSYAM